MNEPETELEFLKRSQENGKWGFSQQFIGPVAQSLITVDLPAWMARQWTLQLLRWRYANGVLAAAPASSNPDAQTVAGTGPRVVLHYGVDSAMERVQMDYNKSGCSVQFHAASIRVYLEAPGTAFGTSSGSSGVIQPPALAPIVAGFITPYGKGPGSADNIPSVTFTTTQFTVSQLGGATVRNIPDRARAYRLVIITEPQNTLLVRQLAGDGVSVVASDYKATLAGGEFPIVLDNGVTQPNHLHPQRPLFMPLMRDAEIIELQNTTALGSTIVALQFLLDVG